MRSALMSRVNSATQRQGWGGGGMGRHQQETPPVTTEDAAVDVTPPRDNVRRTFSSTTKPHVGLRQVPSLEESSSPPSLVSLSLVSSEDASRSSVETGPKQQPQQPHSFATPTRTSKKDADGGSGGSGNDDHPLSPRYLSYRCSLASRLSATPTSPLASTKSVYVSTFSPTNDLEVITGSPIGNRTARQSQVSIPTDADRERRIAAAMLVSDDDDDTDDDENNHNNNNKGAYDILPESVRDRLNKRLGRYQAGTTTAVASAAGSAGPATGLESPSNQPDAEYENEAAATGAGAAAALTAAFSEQSTSTASTPVREFTVHNLNDNNNRNSMTPKSVYSTTSSLTDPNLSTFSQLGAATPDRWKDATVAQEESVDPILSVGTKPPAGGFSPDAHPDDEGSLLGVTRNLNDLGGGGDGDKSPTCLSPRSSLGADQHPARRGRSYMWLMLGGGTLLLLVAVALALAFLLTNRAQSSSQASSATAEDGGNRTVPEEGDPDWSALYPSLYPARVPSSAPPNGTTDDTVIVGSGGPAPTATPTLRRPTPKPTDAPSPPPTYSAENQDLLDLVSSSYVNVFGTDPAAVQRWVEINGTAQQRAFLWLMSAHTAPDRQALGPERLVQRYALATFFYATNGTVLDRVGDDDFYYAYPTGSWLTNDDECRWLPGICRQGRVTNVKLKGVGLVGTIPPEIALLSGLEEINLSENNLRGSLPTELGVLSDLRRLNLRENFLTGTFPVEYEALENVEIIRFDSNLLSGTVPQQVCESYFSSFNATQAHPHLYLDCGGPNPEIACPPGICCTYCCIERNCDCVFANTALEYDLC